MKKYNNIIEPDPLSVIIGVKRGVAYVESYDPGIVVAIKDYDAKERGEFWYHIHGPETRKKRREN